MPITKFDAEFFRCRSYIANKLSPMTRMLLEKTFEAILDAGKVIIYALKVPLGTRLRQKKDFLIIS